MDSEDEFMLTTVDNPYDPFTQFDDWYAFDVNHGYNSCALLDRVVVTSEELSDVDQSLALRQAIDEIVHENVLGLHRRASKQERN